MIRISRMADYALLVVFKMCGREELITLDKLCELTALPLPTLRKLMRSLTHSKLVESVRGPHGGYKLSSQPDQISIAEVIEAIDGPIALTECVKLDGGDCEIVDTCGLKGNWNIVNRLISNALHNVKLDAMGKAPMDVKRLKSALITISE
ncbi:MAG: SUF system Fe-S cluster assembly regulator [Shewanella psychromarinicola]|jgi:FeS assembly SUF system regulator|uniref:SUF system Fe-S cluster assembly regulator n=1 Tax=Shewanella psychromarinicola TaxID=2487742 RepID=UPI003002AE5E|tara:strand:- start:76938 stop:77387 length:450 start_codon:yes stop_codon:yes gene_type:complete